jgi:SHS2 domain-containing protein
VDVLEQCLVWLDTEDWLATGVDAAGENLVGTPLSEEARETGTHVKAITWHQLAVAQGEAGWSATVFVDL